MRSIFLVQIFIFTLLAGSIFAQQRKIETFTVADRRAYCEQLVPKKCLQVKRGNDRDFDTLWDEIEDFRFVAGYEYVLRVEVEKLRGAAKDTSGYRYYLKEMVSRKKTYFDISENLYTERWDLVKHKGAEINNLNAFIRFNRKDGKFFGYTFCNPIRGDFKVENGTIILANFAATERNCPGFEMFDAYLQQDLMTADGFKVETDRLFLTEKGVVSLEFKPHVID